MRATLASLLWRYIPRQLERHLPEEMQWRLSYMAELTTNLFVTSPHVTKRLFVTHAQRILCYPTFVETGTLLGQMSSHASGLFEAVHTIELDPALAGRATAALADHPNVTVHQGDSAEVLPCLLPTIDTPCLFWLDGHYSGATTARGANDTPILAELEAIARHHIRPHAVLIDDGRVFGADDAYPRLEDIFTRLRSVDPEFKIGVAADIIWAAREKMLDFRWRLSADGVVVPPTTAVDSQPSDCDREPGWMRFAVRVPRQHAGEG